MTSGMLPILKSSITTKSLTVCSLPQTTALYTIRPLLLFDKLRENLPQRRTVARQQQLSPEVCLQQSGLLLRFSALYGGRVHRVNVDRPLEANLLAVRGVPVGDRQPPGAVAAVFEGGHWVHLLLKR